MGNLGLKSSQHWPSQAALRHGKGELPFHGGNLHLLDMEMLDWEGRTKLLGGGSHCQLDLSFPWGSGTSKDKIPPKL